MLNLIRYGLLVLLLQAVVATGLQAGMSAGIFTIGLATCNSREAIEDKCNYVLDNFVGMTYEKVVRIVNNE